ncbi:MAG: hypothetical protein RJA31_54 [Actinomycetota bacterium]|jgi:hypothetical protein
MTETSKTTRGIGALTPGEAPTADALFGAIGGVRGIVESIAPGLVFLVMFTITGDLLPSVLAPVGVAVIALIVRLFQRLPVLPAVSGGLGIAASAGLALWTGRAADNFVGGFIINAISLTVFAGSLVIRKPFVGVLAQALAPKVAWMTDARPRRAVTIATIAWAVFFSTRLAVQLPLYFANLTAALAATKLIMGLPMYAGMVWVTWMLLRSSHTTTQS